MFSWGVMCSSTDTSNHACAPEELMRCDVYCCLAVAEGVDVGALQGLVGRSKIRRVSVQCSGSTFCDCFVELQCLSNTDTSYNGFVQKE